MLLSSTVAVGLIARGGVMWFFEGRRVYRAFEVLYWIAGVNGGWRSKSIGRSGGDTEELGGEMKETRRKFLRKKKFLKEGECCATSRFDMICSNVE